MSHERDQADLAGALGWLAPAELEAFRALALAAQELGCTDFDEAPELAKRAAALLATACDRQMLAVAEACGIRLARIAI